MAHPFQFFTYVILDELKRWIRVYFIILRQIISMLRFLPIIILLTVQFSLSGQLYKSFGTKKTSYYSNGELLTVKMDSLKVKGAADTVFYPYRHTSGKPGLPSSCTYNIDNPSWIGQEFRVLPNLVSHFINKDGDTLIFENGIPQFNTFKLYEFPNQDWVECTFTHFDFRQVLGRWQNIKVFQLQVKDMNGMPVVHPFNNKIFEICEHFGFITLFDFWDFPNDTNTIHIVGHEDSVKTVLNTDFDRVFDLQPGNEFHLKTEHLNCGTSPCTNILIHEKKFVLTKDVSSTTDTISISSQRFMVKFIDHPVNGLDTIVISDTVIDTIIRSEYHYLDKFNRELFNYPLSSYGFGIIHLVDTLGPRMRRELHLDYSLDMGNACISPIIALDLLPNYVYGDGLGQTYFQDDTIAGSNILREMVYYQKGVETWGVPFDFGDYVGIDENFKSRISVQVFPNPAHDFINIDISGHLGHQVSYSIINMMGQKISNGVLTSFGPKYKLSVKELQKGLYILNIKTTEGMGSQYFIRL